VTRPKKKLSKGEQILVREFDRYLHRPEVAASLRRVERILRKHYGMG
jgi:hypothetical protein